MGPPEQDSNMENKHNYRVLQNLLEECTKEEASSTIYSIAPQEHHTLRSLSEIKQTIAIEKALETSSLPSSGVVTPSATSTTNLSLLS